MAERKFDPTSQGEKVRSGGCLESKSIAWRRCVRGGGEGGGGGRMFRTEVKGHQVLAYQQVVRRICDIREEIVVNVSTKKRLNTREKSTHASSAFARSPALVAYAENPPHSSSDTRIVRTTLIQNSLASWRGPRWGICLWNAEIRTVLGRTCSWLLAGQREREARGRTFHALSELTAVHNKSTLKAWRRLNVKADCGGVFDADVDDHGETLYAEG